MDLFRTSYSSNFLRDFHGDNFASIHCCLVHISKPTASRAGNVFLLYLIDLHLWRETHATSSHVIETTVIRLCKVGRKTSATVYLRIFEILTQSYDMKNVLHMIHLLHRLGPHYSSIMDRLHLLERAFLRYTLTRHPHVWEWYTTRGWQWTLATFCRESDSL